MLPFGVTIPVAVPQRSEIPEGLKNCPVIFYSRKELEVSGIQDVRSKHKQNWINHLERMDITRNTPSTTNLEEEGIVDALGNDGNASMP